MTGETAHPTKKVSSTRELCSRKDRPIAGSRITQSRRARFRQGPWRRGRHSGGGAARTPENHAPYSPDSGSSSRGGRLSLGYARLAEPLAPSGLQQRALRRRLPAGPGKPCICNRANSLRMSDTPPTHTAFALRKIGERHGRSLEIGTAAGQRPASSIFLDRTPIGGFNGYAYLSPKGVRPPDPQPEPCAPLRRGRRFRVSSCLHA